LGTAARPQSATTGQICNVVGGSDDGGFMHISDFFSLIDRKIVRVRGVWLLIGGYVKIDTFQTVLFHEQKD
jgi:hypothetical protein